jgi:hypothetical protein
MKLLFSIAIILLMAFSPVTPTLINVGDKVTSAGTDPVELQFNKVLGSPGYPVTIYIIVDDANTGTIQFSVGAAPSASSQPYAAGSKIPITIINGYYNLWYDASAASNSFSVTQ